MGARHRALHPRQRTPSSQRCVLYPAVLASQAVRFNSSLGSRLHQFNVKGACRNLHSPYNLGLETRLRPVKPDRFGAWQFGLVPRSSCF